MQQRLTTSHSHPRARKLVEEVRTPRTRIAELERYGQKHTETEEELQETEERLQYLVSSSPAVLYTSDPADNYGTSFVSENIRAQLGYEAWEFIEDPGFWASHIHPEDAPRVSGDLSHLFANGHHIHEYRCRQSLQRTRELA